MRKYFLILGIVVAAAPAFGQAAVGDGSVEGFAVRGERKFTLDQAIQAALQRNPGLLIALKEIERTKGVIIQIRAEALPHITPNSSFQWLDPDLRGGGSSFSTTGGTGGTGGGFGGAKRLVSDVSYNIRLTGTQLIFNGTTWPAIRGTFFQRDSAYFAFRNVLDQLIATVKTQFYQVVVDKALTEVQEESVHLLES